MPCFSRRLMVALLLVLGGLPCPVMESRAGDPSPEYRETLRRTVEARKKRREARGTQQPIGVIVPYPMPPSLIIRHTSEVHFEIESLLRQLRYAPN
jgi:hypothetical protein